jgi:clan AA aspartic protease
MGLTQVVGRVKRPDGRGTALRVRFLVDTGAVYTVLPARVCRTLRLRPNSTAEFGLADGTTIARDVSEARFDIAGRIATSPVILGEADDAPLLGAVTLETLGLMVNPLTREVIPMRPLPMYRMRAPAVT